MTVSDPLIKDLKGWARKLTEANAEITDKSTDLLLFCECLEKCLQQGIIHHLNPFSLSKSSEVWDWVEELVERHLGELPTLSLAVEAVSQNEKIQTPGGKLRLFIRICLVKKCLHLPVQLLVRTHGLTRNYYEATSILGDEILGEIFLSVLLQISRLKFNLNIRNSRFLDDTWQLPEFRNIELVPCKTLGISICFTKGKALIVNVQENSVAAEDDKVEIGDVLDEINGQVLTTNTRGKLGKLLKKSSGLPINLYIIKKRYKSNDLYGPIASLIKNCGIDRLKVILKPQKPVVCLEEKPADIEVKKPADNPGYRVTYCGSILIGTAGDVKQIEPAIYKLIKRGDIKFVDVKFECLEIGIKVTQESDNSVILNQCYMEISSCGRTANIPDYFAFIAGDKNCQKSTKFTAFIFHHRDSSQVQTILQSLAQGFHRTHYAV
ncbi:uncharacterized protein LOC103570751 [Microplitis demolitor]|uniref:uncharacterized protein LOC103570751 n=1 Tax=Microplitis demolitor TaxID=69319 RepID=UPI0004CD1402|nr:uncharacterized protein LOC103570751 [Microplitis demolitor]